MTQLFFLLYLYCVTSKIKYKQTVCDREKRREEHGKFYIKIKTCKRDEKSGKNTHKGRDKERYQMREKTRSIIKIITNNNE